MLYLFLLYRKVNQLYKYIEPLFLNSFPICTGRELYSILCNALLLKAYVLGKLTQCLLYVGKPTLVIMK